MDKIPDFFLKIENDSSLDLDDQVSKLMSIGESVVPYLLFALNEPNNSKLFNLSVRSLCLVGDSAVPGLIDKLKSHNQVTRLYAAKILVGIGENVIPYLRNGYVKSNNSQRFKILKILGSISSPDANDILADAVKSKDQKIKNLAAEALVRSNFIGIKTLIISLENMKGVDFSDPRVSNILKGGRIAAAYLITIVQDIDISYTLRRKSAIILGKLTNFSAIEKLYSDTNSVEMKKLALIAMETYPNGEKFSLFKKGLFYDFETVVEQKTDLSVSEQALLSLANSAFDYLNYVSPMLIDEETMDKITYLSGSGFFDVRKAVFEILCYLRNRYAWQKLKQIFFQMHVPSPIQIEIFFVFVNFWLKRGAPEFILNKMPSELRNVYTLIYQRVNFYDRH